MTATLNHPEVVIDPELAVLIPPLRDDERQLLEQSLLRDGCREPLVVREKDHVLLDGHNRYEICTRLGIPFAIRTTSFASDDDAVLWAVENQLGRRNLSDLDRIALAARREPLLRARAAASQGRRNDLVQNSAGGSGATRTRERAAGAAGVSHDTYTKGKKLLEHGVPELLQAVRNDEASIHAAAAVAELPAEEQTAVVAAGKVVETAKSLRENRRAKNTGNSEWGTPRPVLDAVRQVLGAIDIDPATHESAQRRVQGTTYYTKDDDGLSKPWVGTVFLNPPYSGKLIESFIEKLIDERDAGNVSAAVVLVNNETDAAWFQHAVEQATAICLHRGRIKFLRGDGNKAEHGPLQGQTVLFFGKDSTRFVEVFSKLGVVLAPVTPATEANHG